jgi:hypothetical protein
MRVHSTDSAAFQNFATAMANQVAKRSDVMETLEEKAPAVAEAINRLANKGKHVPPTMPQVAVAQPAAVAVVARKLATAPGQILPPDGAPTRVLTKVDASVARAAHAQASAHAHAASPSGQAFGVTQDAASTPATADAVASAAPPVAPADLGKQVLEDIGVAPQEPDLQVRLQYATLAKRLLELAPAATHDAPHASTAGALKPNAASTRRVDVTA